MKKDSKIRLRFAPSPTGLMHLGNVRTALMNYLFAKQKGGTFILRIEDTDPARNFDPGAKKIMQDLEWLGLHNDEGPIFQSERMGEYEKLRAQLEDKKLIYRCFCTSEELDRKRQRQIAMRIPPRYDKICTKLSDNEIQKNVFDGKKFIWRVTLDHTQTIVIKDLARGEISFELKNFSDFPITRQDGSFTFMFANFVDDMLMNISHVVRGEDHLTNTAGQAYLYGLFNVPQPIFWHLPILCNIDGKKLSKRDFGFSLGDIKQAGFLPQALLNYLAISGGGTFEQEIMSLDELVEQFNFDIMHATGQVRYDVEKLKWLNHKWINRIDTKELMIMVRPFLAAAYPQEIETVDQETLIRVIDGIKTDLTVLQDAPIELEFYFKDPVVDKKDLAHYITAEYLEVICPIINNVIQMLVFPHKFVEMFKEELKKGVPIKYGFFYVRMALTGKPHGLGIIELVTMLGKDESEQRIQRVNWVIGL